MGTFKRLGFVLMMLCLLMIGLVMPTLAQGDGLYVCRDPRFATVRLEFHNIPADWQNPDGAGWWYLAEAGAMYGNTLVADATTEPDPQLEALGIGIGSAIVGKGDYSESLVGNAQSDLCDPTLSPIQDDGMVIVLTPPPIDKPDPCPAIAMDYGSMQWYCYTPVASGIVPIPPAPKQ